MKFKTTSKQMRDNYGDKAIQIGYCEAQTLLSDYEPIAYSSGVYGWNCDYYLVDNVLIVTGYRGMFGRHISYKLVDKYEKKAITIKTNYDLSYEARKRKINKLLHRFISDTLEVK